MFTFFVPGKPTPQGSKILQTSGNKTWIREADKNLPRWRDMIRTVARDTMKQHNQTELFSYAVSIDILFLFDRPKSVSVNRHYPNVKPDIDKLCRAVLDGLTGVMITDDGKVVDLTARKAYVTPQITEAGALITVSGYSNDSVTVAWERYKKNLVTGKL